MSERWQDELRKLRNLEPPDGLWERALAGSRRRAPRLLLRRGVLAPAAAALAVLLVAGGLGLVQALTPAKHPLEAAGGAPMSVSLAQAERGERCADPGLQEGGPLPQGFVARAAIRCIYSDQTVPGQGVWQFELRQVAYNGLTSLMAALRQPSAIKPANLACAAPGIEVGQFALWGQDGRVVSPQLPTTKCGLPQQQALTAVRALHWTTVSSQRELQVESAAGVKSGCASGWKDMLGFLSERRFSSSLRPSPGGPVFSTRPAQLRVCVYSDQDQSDPTDTYLTGGGLVSGSTETRLLTGIAGSRGTATCAKPHTSFAVLLPVRSGAQPAYVELGGCQRVLRPDNRVGQASAAALTIISQAGKG